MLDLAAYLARTGHAGPVAPDLATLEALVFAHTTAIAFENLDPLRGVTPDLAPEAIFAKLVHGRRGGYCFEHNALFAAVLRAIGFQVTGLGARVVLGMAPDGPAPRTHMILRVDLPDGPRIVDVGFGGLTPTGVLRLDQEGPQPTPHGPFRVVPGPEHFTEALTGGEWKPLYRYDLVVQQPIDYHVANHYTATHPTSRFTFALNVARATPTGRLALRDRVYTTYGMDGESSCETLTTTAALRATLAGPFGLAVPDDPRLDAALERLPAPG